MRKHDSFLQAQEQLRSLPKRATLAILHPDFHGQNRLLAQPLADKSAKTVFVTLPESQLALTGLIGHLQGALASQLGVALAAHPSPGDTAAALAQTMADQGGVTLIISAYDRARQEEVVPFIQALVPQLRPGSRLILGTRELPMALLTSPALRERTAIVPVNPDKMMLDYVHLSDQKVLEVRALGPGRVLINGQLISHWDGVLPRMLFFFFVDQGMTTRDEIFQTFWPTLSTREATNVFHVTKRKISEILGTDLTVYWSGFYRISPDLELHYDVVKFAEAVQNAAVATDEDALLLLHNAIDLYRGPFLSNLEQPWIAPRRAELANSCSEALAVLARLYAQMNEQHNALGFFLRAAAANPHREDLVRHIMEIFQKMGMPGEALDAYNRLRAELKRSLDVEPDPKTQALADTIRASR
jgi:DNA-binding SARP family transcriptional activator